MIIITVTIGILYIYIYTHITCINQPIKQRLTKCFFPEFSSVCTQSHGEAVDSAAPVTRAATGLATDTSGHRLL